MAKEKKQPTALPAIDYTEWVDTMQRQIEADIQAIKGGALDEELLRTRLFKKFNPSSQSTQLTLWMCALIAGIIDDLEIIVSATAGGRPLFQFFPQYNAIKPKDAKLVFLRPPGSPERVEPQQTQASPGLPAPTGELDELAS